MTMEFLAMEGRAPFGRRLRMGVRRGIGLWPVMLGFLLVAVSMIGAVALYQSAR